MPLQCVWIRKCWSSQGDWEISSRGDWEISSQRDQEMHEPCGCCLQILREPPQGVARPRARGLWKRSVGVPGRPLLMEVLGWGSAVPRTAAWFVYSAEWMCQLRALLCQVFSPVTDQPVPVTPYNNSFPCLCFVIHFVFHPHEERRMWACNDQR